MKAQTTWIQSRPTALLVLADGTVLEGTGFGATGHAVGEVCFNTAMTGYQEILTDPSYAGQIITFTFPHIGNVGANDEDIETVNLAATPGARGVILGTAITQPSNYRAALHLDAWLKRRGIIGLAGIDTRALTSLIRSKGMPNAVIAHAAGGEFDRAALAKEAREWPGLVGMDLVPMVTSAQRFTWDETPWAWGNGYGRQDAPQFHVVAVDYGIKRNILRQLAGIGARVSVVPPVPVTVGLAKTAVTPAGSPPIVSATGCAKLSEASSRTCTEFDSYCSKGTAPSVGPVRFAGSMRRAKGGGDNQIVVLAEREELVVLAAVTLTL